MAVFSSVTFNYMNERIIYNWWKPKGLTHQEINMNTIRKKDDIDIKIVETVNQKPGIQLKELCGVIGKSLETIRYRVYRLERNRDVKLESSERYLKIYPFN